jgi:DNA (cytosine-5)-methyltransferase 1
MKTQNDQIKKIKVAELFAGVGGFRVGLNRASKKESKKTGLGFETVWSNQWEPSTKKQHASEVYMARFGKEGHSNKDIAKVEINEIGEHNLLVGGFPCQDYSVARTLSQAAGLKGKKGVLWWEIYRILSEKKPTPDFLFLENVDRLLKSPASNRGKDFAIMLSSLAKLGYVVEWRVINAGEYGKPQRRRRTYILGYKKSSSIGKEMMSFSKKPKEWMLKKGVIVDSFKIQPEIENEHQYNIGKDPVEISERFTVLFPDNIEFLNTGIMIDGQVHTVKAIPKYGGKSIVIKDILEPEDSIPEEYYIPVKDLKNWKYLKGGKSQERTSSSGFKYKYSEGPMVFPDSIEKPSRTIITAEGGSTPSRFKHVIEPTPGVYRRLTPIELERLCQFDDNHTKLEGIPDTRRAFFMGNALVVGVIEDIGRALLRRIAVNETN